MQISDLYRQLFGRSGTTKGSDIDMAEHARLGGISTGEPYKKTYDLSASVAEKVTKVDKVVYYAMASAGSVYSDPVWQVKKVDASDSNNIYTTWADGDIEFNNVADDLTVLDYK